MVEVVKSYDPLLEEGEFAVQNKEANKRADERFEKWDNALKNIGGTQHHARIVIGGKVNRLTGTGELTIDIQFCDSAIEPKVNTTIFSI